MFKMYVPPSLSRSVDTERLFCTPFGPARYTHTRTSKYARPESVRTLVRLSVEPFFAGRCSVRAITTALPLRPTDRRSVSDSLKTNCRRDESDFVTRRKVALEFHSPLLLCRNKKKNPRNISNEIGSYDRIVRVNARGNKNDFTSSTHFPSPIEPPNFVVQSSVSEFRHTEPGDASRQRHLESTVFGIYIYSARRSLPWAF